jgi:parallel beta-helix repeat protein
MAALVLPAVCTVCLGLWVADDPPVVTLRSDDTVITQSCRIEIPPNLMLLDSNRDGVVHVAAADIVIEFERGAQLRGAERDAPPDTYEGFGIRVVGQRNVTVRGGRISGFRAGLWATDCPGLTLENIDASDGRRAHLDSDAEIEAEGDWLSPHHNDDHEWLRNYGSSIYVERSDRIVVRNCRVWHSQNALCLDRVNEARVYDNDFSFNSGWGIALWRSCRNVITRNALDFCIRGYSHGVYNRGQDAAGLLMFEQDSDNVIAENSVTHGGDGLFGWAGEEAMRRTATHFGFWILDFGLSRAMRCGADRNLLIRNDFSYAAAHGIELTFSFDNQFLANRIVGNAICGIWAGYSQGTLIRGNEIADNGAAGYGLERGGVNIDSSRQNRIIGNKFSRNACGVHLWWQAKPNPGFADWIAASLPDWEGNVLAGNEFRGDELAFHFRGPGKVVLGTNAVRDVRREMEAAPETRLVRDDRLAGESVELPSFPVFGQTHPVGARPELAGREHIIMTEWGPWDHATPLVWPLESTGGRQTLSLRQFGNRPSCTVEGVADWKLAGAGPEYTLTLAADKSGVHPYRVAVESGEFQREVRGALLVAEWQASCFRFAGDPVEEPDRWAAAGGPDTRTIRVSRLDDPDVLDELKALPQPAGASADSAKQSWGLSARTDVPLKRGVWQIVVVAAGGVRVSVAGEKVIDAWERPGPARRLTGRYEAGDGTVALVVEQFAARRPTPVSLRILPGK